jgi:hypothetical protein
MKTKVKKVEQFDAVKVFRDIKEKISSDINGMSFEQLSKYLSERKLKSKA